MYRRGRPGAFLRSTITERFTSAKVSRKMRLAADPTASIGSVSAMAIRSAPVTPIATWGVRRSGWIVAIRGGSHRSRPIEKATLDEARMVAFSADMVDRSPPKTITATPKDGMNPSAARTIAVSP